LPRYKNSCPGTKIHAQVQKFIPRFKNSYPGTKALKLAIKIQSWVEDEKPTSIEKEHIVRYRRTHFYLDKTHCGSAK
jgi:hypothetical protein